MKSYNARLKPQKAEQAWKTKIETKNKDNKQKTVTNMVDINLTTSVITLNVSDVNMLIKAILSEWIIK